MVLKVLAIPKRSTSGPDIADAIHVVNDETLIVTDPVFSKIAVQQYGREHQATRKRTFQHLQLEMSRIQMHVFAVMRDTNWKVVIYLWRNTLKERSRKAKILLWMFKTND